MASMVRKQVYIERRQDDALKRAARQRGVTEAELIREALDLRREGSRGAPDRQAWLSFKRSALRQRKKRRSSARPRAWTRAELYDERIGRWIKS